MPAQASLPRFRFSVAYDVATFVGAARRPLTSTKVLLTVPDAVWCRHPVMAVLSSANMSSPAMIHARFCSCLFVFISCPPFLDLMVDWNLSLIHISEPTRLGMISYA